MKNITKKIATALLAAIIAASFAACSGSTDDDDSDITETDRTEAGGKKTTDSDGNTDKFDFPTDKSEKGIRITPSEAKKIQTELYECADFSLTIPKGWKVTSGGVNIYHSIRVYDPSEPLNQMFILLKADCLLHSQAGKDAWQYNYSMGNQQAAFLAAAPVLQNPSTEGFFNIFSQYSDFATQFEPTYSGYTFPRFDGFTVTERFAAASGMAASLGEELLRADFTDGGKAGEGMFSASVVDFGSTAIAAGMNGYMLQQADGGYYMAYNVMAVTAAKDTFIEWESVLTDCMKTLQHSDSFVSSTNQASNEKVALSQQISRNFNQTMDGIMSSWENRNKSQDIISQKQSDATLGYERVYDTETNEIYRATNGFTDVYDGSRYKSVTDDSMYSEPISGYIERVG